MAHAMTHIGPSLVIIGEFDSQDETTTIASKMAHYRADHAPALTASTAGTATIR